MKTANSNPYLGTLAKVMLIAAFVLLVISLFVPMWRIELSAPQYPEGLILVIYTHKLAGNVDIINGLNHYIGMKTLHTKDFPEFTILPYLIGIFAAFTLLVAIIGRKKWLYALTTAFILFGIIAMIDFWRWEYEYGHDLNPDAAIIVPGMAYQPPLIGFKQLLNFGAYSIPDLGGWFFVGSGLLMVGAILAGRKKGIRKPIGTPVLILLASLPFVGTAGCSRSGPEPILVNRTACAYCKMTVSDLKFSAEGITKQGRIYMFDDVACLKSYMAAQGIIFDQVYVADFLPPNTLLRTESLVFITGPGLVSPMNGSTAAFTDSSKARPYLARYNAHFAPWQQIVANSE